MKKRWLFSFRGPSLAHPELVHGASHPKRPPFLHRLVHRIIGPECGSDLFSWPECRPDVCSPIYSIMRFRQPLLQSGNAGRIYFLFRNAGNADRIYFPGLNAGQMYVLRSILWECGSDLFSASAQNYWAGMSGNAGRIYFLFRNAGNAGRIYFPGLNAGQMYVLRSIL